PILPPPLISTLFPYTTLFRSYRTDTLDVDQRLKITSLTFLFTDLKGSTELYERVGDLVAYDLVRAHFQVLNEIVAAERGAVVKTDRKSTRLNSSHVAISYAVF